MSRVIPISAQESAALMRAAEHGQLLNLTFPGGDLIIKPGNYWAYRVLAEMRGLLEPDFLMCEDANSVRLT